MRLAPPHLHVAGVGCRAVTRLRGDRRAAHQLEAVQGRERAGRLRGGLTKTGIARKRNRLGTTPIIPSPVLQPSGTSEDTKWSNKQQRTHTHCFTLTLHATAMASPHSYVRTPASAHSRSLGAPGRMIRNTSTDTPFRSGTASMIRVPNKTLSGKWLRVALPAACIGHFVQQL